VNKEPVDKNTDCGLTAAAVIVAAAAALRRRHTPRLERKTDMTQKIGRPLARPAVTEDQVNCDPSRAEFHIRWPRLQEFLEKPRPCGDLYTTGCLTIFFEDGRFKVAVNDRPNRRSTFVSGTMLTECLTIIERGLRGNSLKWRTVGWKDQRQPQSPLK